MWKEFRLRELQSRENPNDIRRANGFLQFLWGYVAPEKGGEFIGGDIDGWSVRS